MVKYIRKKFGIIILIFLIIYMINSIDYSKAKPNVIEINSIPSPPIPLENVTIIAGLNNSIIDSINEIRLIANECIGNFSLPGTFNISLNYTYSCCMDFYEGTFKLEHNNSTKIKYHLEILSNGIWYKYNISYIDMFINSDKNLIENEENQTPGFELILMVCSIMLLIFLQGKKT